VPLDERAAGHCANGERDAAAAGGRNGQAPARHHPRLKQELREDHDLRQFRSRYSARRIDLGVRAERLRQKHLDQHDRRAHSGHAGQILFDGRQLAEIKFGYVFQNYREALFPWMRAFDNIAYPLKLMNVPRGERRIRTEKLVAHLGIKLDLGLYPYQMSGGQQQLVSILRALVVEPEILFLDEPFSALDYEMTLFMREQLQRIFLETGTTTILVSHDLEEAVFLADKVLLLSRHPARVAAFTSVTAVRPRTDATLSESDFVRTKAECLEIFQREVRRA
jgi:NitT/TauT family transport system ATP-binding protein